MALYPCLLVQTPADPGVRCSTWSQAHSAEYAIEARRRSRGRPPDRSDAASPRTLHSRFSIQNMPRRA